MSKREQRLAKQEDSTRKLYQDRKQRKQEEFLREAAEYYAAQIEAYDQQHGY